MEQLIQQTKSRKYNLPQDWSIKKFDDIGQVIDGDRGKNYPSKEDFLPLGDCLFLSAKNVTDEGFKFNDLQFISADRDFLMSKGKLKREDIVLTTRGTVGNLVYFDREVPFNNIRINSGMVILRLKDQALDNQFIFRALQSEYIKKQISRVIFGSAQPQLTKKIIENFQIFLPKLKSEQHAIAEVLSDVDALIEAQEALIEKKRLIKQGVMQELLTCKRRFPGFIRELKTIKIKEIAEVIKGKGLSKSKLSQSGQYECILYGELFTTYDEIIDEVYSSTDTYQGEISEYGDVLIPGSTTTVGIDLCTASALLKEGILLGGDINIIRSKSSNKYSPEFLAYYISYLKKFEIEKAAQGITIIHLYGSEIEEINIAVPPLNEQIEIVNVIKDIDKEINYLEEKVNKMLLIKQGMMQELLTGRTRLV